MSIPIIDTIDWTTPRLPSDLVDYVTAASLSESVQPLTNRSAYLRNLLETTGIRRVQTLATVAALRAVEAIEGDVVKVDGLGLFVFVPGAAPPMQPTDFSPWWIRTTNPVTLEGRWENLALYATTLNLGPAEGAIPVLDEDGRLTVSAPNAVIRMPFLGKQATTVTSSVAPSAYLDGTLNLGSLAQNDIVDIVGVVHVKSYTAETIVLNLNLTADGSLTTLVNLYPPDHPDYSVAAYEVIPVHHRFQASSAKEVNTIRVQMVGSATSTPRGNIQSLAATVVRP